MEHLTTRIDIAHAFAFGGGVGLYLIGTIIFRRASGISQVLFRYVAAALALLTSFPGSYVSAALQFSSLILILVILLLVESDWVHVRTPAS